MNKISCIAVDDEPLALGLIVSYIQKTPFLDLKNSFDNPIDAMEFLEDNPVQLLFLDIQMPDLTGVEFARILDKNSRVIFTTAYDQYAIRAFEVHALDYLLKPFDRIRFQTTMARVREALIQKEGGAVNSVMGLIEDDYCHGVLWEFQQLRTRLSGLLLTLKEAK